MCWQHTLPTLGMEKFPSRVGRLAYGKKKKPAIVLEAIGDGELWIWHHFFGSAGSLNDINIIDHSTTLDAISPGNFPPDVKFVANCVEYCMLYYLADCVYPNWRLFLRTITEKVTPEEKLFAIAQEAIRKDVERAFGVLVARFHILARPAWLWYRSNSHNRMTACIIMRSMVVEARRESYESEMSSLRLFQDVKNLFQVSETFKWQSRAAIKSDTGTPMTDFMWGGLVLQRKGRISSTVDHFALKHDLIAHVRNEHST